MGKLPSPSVVRLLFVLLLTFWAGAAFAEKRVALVIGNSQYARASLKLVTPTNDAQDLARVLTAIGFDVILRTDVGKGNFDQALVDFAGNAKNADTALFYYAGHGFQRNGKNYFRSRTNVFYIPMKNDTAEESLKELSLKRDDRSAFGAAYAEIVYDYKMSRALLDHLCDSPAKEITPLCEGDLSRGPFIFVYAKPASNVTPVPPPFLLVDLSDVHERAFPEFIAAFRAQVKREDISDRAKIDTLRLAVLSIALTAADWLVPVQKALGDIVHSASGQAEKDKK